jgi:urease accessory protein
MSRKSQLFMRAALCLAVLLPTVASAHPGHGAGASFSAGVLHPLAGLDHLFATLAVGMLAARMRGKAGIAVAVAFLGLLAAGIASGFAGVELPFSEVAIGMSVIVTALLVIRPPRRLPTATALIGAVFAFYHGAVHGLEAANGTAPLQYAAGLLTSSALLVGVGAVIAAAFQSRLAPAKA